MDPRHGIISIKACFCNSLCQVLNILKKCKKMLLNSENIGNILNVAG